MEMKRVGQVIVVSVFVLVLATVSLAQMGWQTFRDSSGNIIAECTTMGSQTICRDMRPRPPQMVSGSRANHLIGKTAIIKPHAVGFVSPDVAMIVSRAALDGGLEGLKAVYRPLKTAGLAMPLIAGLKVEILDTADHYKAPLVQVREVDTIEHETCWTPVQNLAKP
jgi:hypothetical protein